MNTTQRTVLLALVFALVASSLLAVDMDAKRKRGKRQRENRAPITRVVRNDPNSQFFPDLSARLPNILTISESEVCAEAERVVQVFLSRTVLVKKTDSVAAKLTVNEGISVLACNLSNGLFEIRLNNVELVHYAKQSGSGLGNGDLKPVASVSGAIRVSFALSSSPAHPITLTDLNVLTIEFVDVPSWLDSITVRNALDHIFPYLINAIDV